jgi:integrase
MGEIHITQELAESLLLWKQQCPNPNSGAFIFSNSREGFIDADRFRKQLLRKLADELQLPKLTFQVIRRTIATLAQTMGSVKDIQGILRHASASTTADVYMQEIPEGIKRTLLSINNELRAIPSSFNLEPNGNADQSLGPSVEFEVAMNS